MARPDGGMYSIKLIHPNHLNYPYLTEDFDGSDGRRTLMNFSRGTSARESWHGPAARTIAATGVKATKIRCMIS